MFRIVLVLTGLGVVQIGCGPTEPATPILDSAVSGDIHSEDSPNRPSLSDPNEVKEALLDAVAHDVIVPTLQDFASTAQSLSDAANAYASDQTEENLLAAQEAWRVAMASWQKAEVMQVGPAGVMGDVLGGDDKRDEIYSWPVTNECRIDQETLEEAHTVPADLAKEGVNTRGLDAIEYLLFHPLTKNGCKINSAINKNGTWKEMQDTLPQRQAKYAAVAAQLVLEEANSLLSRWQEDGGNFGATLQNAGNGSQIYASVQEGLNAISDAMFYIEKTTKDMKLAEPLGFIGCDDETCPDSIENPHAGFSKAAVLANLQGISLMYHGGAEPENAVGFHDLLISYGATDLAEQMASRLAGAIEAVEAIPGSLADALDNDIQAFEDAYAATKEFTDLFKTQFLSVLDLEIPQRAASDND